MTVSWNGAHQSSFLTGKLSGGKFRGHQTGGKGACIPKLKPETRGTDKTLAPGGRVSGKGVYVPMCNENMTPNAAQSKVSEEVPVLIRKIGKTTYKVRIHFSNTSTETMSDKIKRMLKNEIQQMKEY